MKAARLFSASLAALWITLANVHKSAQAEQLANSVSRTEIAPEIDLSKLPRDKDGCVRTCDGRLVAEGRAAQFENQLQKRWARGELPHPRTLGIEASFATIKLVGGRIAALDDGTGCFAGLAWLARELNRCESQIREVCRYLRATGYLQMVGRVAADDRKIGGAKWPLTSAKTTIRKLWVLPLEVAKTLTEDEVLDLIAYGEQKPLAALADDPPAREEARAEAAPKAAPKVDQKPTAQASPETSLDVRAIALPLEGPLADLAELTGHKLDAAWAMETARREQKIDDVEIVAQAIRDATSFIRTHESAARAVGKSVRRSSFEAVVGRVLSALKGKRIWLDKGGQQAQLASESKAREETYRDTYKTPEQLERENGTAVRRGAAGPSPEEVARSRAFQKIALAILCEEDPVKRAALVRERDAALAALKPPE